MWISVLFPVWIWVVLSSILLVVAPNAAETRNSPSSSLLDAFRAHYAQFEIVMGQVHTEPTDPFLLQLLGEDLNQFSQLAHEHRAIFEPEEAQILQSSLQVMILDVRALHEQRMESSHHGRPEIVFTEYTGRPGRPRTVIDPNFLHFAHRHRTTTGLSHFLDVPRPTVRRRLLECGLASPGTGPFNFPTRGTNELRSSNSDEVLDANAPQPLQLPDDVQAEAAAIPSSSSPGYVTVISNEQLDSLLTRLRIHYHRAGIRMLDGMLRRLNILVPYEHIRQSLVRIDPVHRVFDRIRIRRRGYSVPGPNSLWHHDGHHRLIRWGIVIHGFIDGYSRLITGLRASNNNRGQTVLSLFLSAAEKYQLPSRVRGDHGIENIWVAAFMEHAHGEGRGSYLWGRSVHNVRIERLWVDISHYCSQAWHDMFTLLETRHGLQVSNPNHIWLLQHLFLPMINEQLTFWAESWNHHRVSQRTGPARSPEDMFVFDSLVNGVRGDDIGQFSMTDEELEVFGVDWEGLQDETLLRTLRSHYADEGPGSWLGRRGPPPDLNEVAVSPPSALLTHVQVAVLDQQLQHHIRLPREQEVIQLWIDALAIATTMYPNEF